MEKNAYIIYLENVILRIDDSTNIPHTKLRNEVKKVIKEIKKKEGTDSNE